MDYILLCVNSVIQSQAQGSYSCCESGTDYKMLFWVVSAHGMTCISITIADDFFNWAILESLKRLRVNP